MKNILFIEDRYSRLQHFLPEDDIKKLEEFEQVKFPISQEVIAIVSALNNKIYEDFDDLSLIIIHSSALDNVGYEYLWSKCKEYHISLVLFSGGMGSATYSNDEIETLRVSSADLYSHRLLPFLEDYINDDENHLIALTENNWKVSYWLLLRQLINTKKIEKEDSRIRGLDLRIATIKKIIHTNVNELDEINTEIEKLIIAL